MGMSAQKEQLKAIGTRLSEERQKKSISLEEIAAKTYIPQRLLTAIEDANLDRLPEPVFIQGFIRRFADALGLDGMAMSKEFTVDPAPLPAPATASLISNTIEPQSPKPPVSLNGASTRQTSISNIPEPITPPPAPTTPEPPAIRDPQPVQKSIEPAAVRDPIPEPRPSIDASPSRLPLIALAGAIGLGVIGVLAATLTNRPAERSTPPAATAPATNPAQPPVAVQPPRSPAPVTSAPASPSPAVSPSPTGSATVKMNVTEESWVEVLVDGNSVYEGTLTKGTQQSWSGNQIVVNTGNAGGVSLSYNNGAAKPMGASGEVQTATFPPAP
jgi:cytoskeleton protein RodZ